MRKIVLLILTVALIIAPLVGASADDKIKKVKDDIKKSRITSDTDDTTFFIIFYYWIEIYLKYTFSDGGFRYLNHPYQNGLMAYLVDEEISPRPFALNCLFGYQNVNSKIEATLFDIRLRCPSGSSFSLSYTVFEEQLDTGGYEYLSFYSFMQRASLISKQPIDITLDFGVNHFPGMQRGGISYGFGIELFPAPPLFFTFHLRQHLVATGQDVTESFLGVGLVLRNFEPIFGFRVFDFHGFSGGVDLSGVVFAIQIRL